MNKRIGIVFSDFGPYHVARIEALANALKQQGDELYAFRFFETSSTYGWKPVVPSNATVATLGEKEPNGFADAWRIASALKQQIKKSGISSIFLPSYSPMPNLLSVLAARMAGCKLVLMNESWRLTERSSLPGKWAKHFLVRQFSAALVGGAPQKQYACDYGQDPNKVFLGYDVVDTTHFSREADKWKNAPPESLPVPNLPQRFFLNLGRFVEKKNIPQLIEAYASLVSKAPALAVALVLVGEGNEEKKLRELVKKKGLAVREGLTQAAPPLPIPEVVFYPFQQVELTPVFFARSEAFILPSLYEEWGLVINEAMASNAAVLVSKNVGCAFDLVEDGVNGFRFDPNSVADLEEKLLRFIQDPYLSERMGAEGRKMIQHWGPERFAQGALQALQAAG